MRDQDYERRAPVLPGVDWGVLIVIKPLFVLAAFAFAMPAFAQEAAPAGAPAALPMCSATVKDGCQQTKGQEARAMSGAQAEARDAKSGGWAPNAGGSDKDMAAPMAMKTHHKAGHKRHHAAKQTTVTTTTTEAAPK